ncbi:hypothetical protein CO656_22470 [Sinorhizobium sp. FG01]|nr:hypothetical protein CO656_22470 [Sinorhizobium sp. FG01]PDT50737.1 hypothetical protein CO664_24975 [Sinorhizobium sp. NG07B]
MLQPVRRDATWRRQNFPRRAAAPRRSTFSRRQVLHIRFGLARCIPPFRSALSPRDDRNSKGDPSCNNSPNSSPPPAAGSGLSAR